MLKISRHIIFILSLGIFIVGIIFSSPYTLFFGVITLLIQNFWYALEKFYERIIFFAFNATFFIFLIGRIVVNVFFEYKTEAAELFGLAFTDVKVINHIFISQYLSLLFVYLGFLLIIYLNSKKKITPTNINKKKDYWKSFQLFSKYFFYSTVIFRIMYLIEAINVSQVDGYYETFASFQSTMPGPLLLFSEMYDVAFFSFLASNPKKRESILPIGLYLAEGVFSLISGRRSGFILNILIIFIYLCLKNLNKNGDLVEKKERWIGKKQILSSLLIIPILMVASNVVGEFRGGGTASDINIFNSIFEFLFSQGISANVIGFAHTLSISIPEGKIYSIGPIMEFIDNKIIGHYIHGEPVFIGQTVDRAMNGYLFSHTISYLIMPRLYLMGIGYGSSYIAELYTDFGYFGIVIGSLIYGILFGKLSRWFYSNNIIIVIVTLLMTRTLMFAPRAGMTSFIVSTFSLPKIAAIIIIIVGAFIVRAFLVQDKTRIKNMG